MLDGCLCAWLLAFCKALVPQLTELLCKLNDTRQDPIYGTEFWGKRFEIGKKKVQLSILLSVL